MRQTARSVVLAFAFSLMAGAAFAQTNLRIGLGDDPDGLDPTLSRFYTTRIVFAAMCDKLFDIDEKANIVPQLALSHETSEDGKTVIIKLRPGVKFHDGEPRREGGGGGGGRPGGAGGGGGGGGGSRSMPKPPSTASSDTST